MTTNNKMIAPDSIESFFQAIFNKMNIQRANDWQTLIGLWLICEELDQLNQWYKGDIACKVESKYGEGGLEKFAQELGISSDTIVAYRRTSRAFDVTYRGLNLTWTHYFLASRVDSWDKKKKDFKTKERFKWVDKAHDEGWSVGKLRAEVEEFKAKEQRNLYGFYLGGIKHFEKVIFKWAINELPQEQKLLLADALDDVVRKFRESLSK